MLPRAITRVGAPIVIGLVATFAVANGALAQRAGESGMLDPKSGRFRDVFTNEPSHAPDTLAMPAPQLFSLLARAYEALSVPISVVDSATRSLGAIRVTIRRPIGGRRMSTLLECGVGAYGPNADRYSVQLSMVSSVNVIDSTHSALETQVQGAASPNGLSTTVRCASTGQLEELVLDLVRKASSQ